jgi:hypothetical protein
LHKTVFLITIIAMSKLAGYMVTWTTYGTWLQGDKRGFVKNGEILPGDESLHKLCENLQKNPTAILNEKEKVIVRDAIVREAERIGHQLEAIVACTNHVHLAARPFRESIESIVNRYKNIATRALRQCDRKGRVWTIGFH